MTRYLGRLVWSPMLYHHFVMAYMVIINFPVQGIENSVVFPILPYSNDCVRIFFYCQAIFKGLFLVQDVEQMC
jgi:hypothetical protein